MRSTVTACALITAAAFTSPSSAGAAWESVEIIRSPTRNTWCDHLVDYSRSRNKVQCTAADLAGPSGRRMYELQQRGRSRVFTRPGDPGDGSFTARYGRWLYFYGGTAKVQGGRKDLRCIFRRTGLTCINESQRGFRLRLGHQRRF